MRVRVMGLVLCVASAVAAAAQSSTTKLATDPANFGTVIGHVYLPGNNLPARFANVALQPVDMKPLQRSGSSDDAKMPVTVVQTGLDGGYRLEHVTPGSYYVVVNLPGYLSPIAQFTMDQLKNPTPEIQQKISATVPTVNVSPNGAATADVWLAHGASLSGMVKFDDGSPATTAKLGLMKRQTANAWSDVQGARNLHIDGEGQFRVDGLEAGDYMLHLSVILLTGQKVSAALGWVTNSMSTGSYTLDIYSGDTTLRSEAKVLTLADGQALSGQDLTIPVSMLHAVSGSVIDARTGQALNAGQVRLTNVKGEGAAIVSIDAETRTFTFAFAPEGEYTLKIRDAREVQFEPASADAGSRQRAREKLLRAYETGEMPVIIHGEMSGLTLPVNEKPIRANNVGGGTP
jgi:hypothetical protein